MKQLQAHLELPAVVAVSLSSMLGSGIFVLPGIASAKTGPSIWLAYISAALCVLPAALSKSELATAMPNSGGTYVYLDRAFGPLAGTVSGLGLWLSLLLKCAFALVGLGVYLDVIAHLPIKGFALVIVCGIVLLNIRGVRGVSQVQFVLTALCLIVLSALVLGGVFSFEMARLSPPFAQGVGGFISATGFIFVSFAGVTKVAAIAEEIHNPDRNLPAGILLSLGLITLVYGGVALVLVGVIPGAELAKDLRPIHTLAQVVGGPMLGSLTALVGVLTLASMANAGLLAASRFPFAMSRDNLLPAFLGRLDGRHLTPVWSILLSGAVIAGAILLLDVEKLAKLASAFMIMMYCSVSLAVIALRETHVQWYTPSFRSPLYPMTQIFGIVAGLVLLLIMGFTAVAAASAIGMLGAALFLFYGRRRTERLGVLPQRGRRRDILRSINFSLKTLAEADAGEEAAVVVALFGSERSPEMLVELGEALREGGCLEVIHLTEIPEQTGLDALMDDMPLLRSVRRRVRAMADRRRIPLEFESLVSRDIIKSIDEITSRLHSEWLVVEWTGRTREALTIRNPLGWLRDHVSCNLAVFYDAGVRYLREILVYVEPDNHDILVISTAKHLAQVYEAKLTLLGFVPEKAPLTHTQREADYLDQLRALCPAGTETLLVNGRTPAAAIGQASAGYDLLVTAEQPHRNLWRRIRGTGSDRITETAAACSVLRLQSPMDRTHETFDWDKAREELQKMQLSSYLDQSCITVNLPPCSKEELFETIARTFGEAAENLEEQEILEALWKRERVRGTAAGMGLAMPHATVSSARRTRIGIFTTQSPLDYGAPDSRGVDVLFVTIGGADARRSHLVVMSAISKVVLETSLLKELRAAESLEEVLRALDAACAQVKG